jgi:hypothetical protein
MKTLLILSIAFLFFSCDKEKQSARRMKGEWELQNFKMTFPDGLSEFGEGAGTLKIEDSDRSEYQLRFVRELNSQFSSGQFTETAMGYMNFRDKGKYIDVVLVDENGSILSEEAHRILIQTKTDLQLEYSHSSGRFLTLTFRSKN